MRRTLAFLGAALLCFVLGVVAVATGPPSSDSCPGGAAYEIGKTRILVAVDTPSDPKLGGVAMLDLRSGELGELMPPSDTPSSSGVASWRAEKVRGKMPGTLDVGLSYDVKALMDPRSNWHPLKL
jgi:hypothetical protein